MPRKTSLSFIILLLNLASLAPAARADQDQALAGAIKAYAARTKAEVTSFEPRQIAFVDLNGDGVKDALVLLQGPSWCGTGGCTLLVFKGGKDNFTFVSRSTLVRGPLLVSDHQTKGWRDLVLEVSGGGMPAKKVALKFNGRQYPLNPSIQKAIPKDDRVSGETVFQPKN